MKKKFFTLRVVRYWKRFPSIRLPVNIILTLIVPTFPEKNCWEVSVFVHSVLELPLSFQRDEVQCMFVKVAW